MHLKKATRLLQVAEFGKVKHIDINSNKIDVEIARGVVITVDKGYVFADAEAMRMSQNK